MGNSTKHLCYDEILAVERGNYVKPVKILVVGTFNPTTVKNKLNEAKWFYGREVNEFWFLFPRMLGLPSIHPADIEDDDRDHHVVCKEFCEKHNVLIVDIIKEVRASLKGFTDSEIDALALDDVIPFDYSEAFRSYLPDRVIFTWKGKKGKVTGVLKERFMDFLRKNNIEPCQMPSASPFYRKGRKAKLDEWKQAYAK
jgi:hypothetical protein